MSTSQFLSKNPIFKFKFKGDEFKKKDKLIMTWIDRKGKTKTSKSKIK
jgi:sulfur-oxidizing protein SoxZ